MKTAPDQRVFLHSWLSNLMLHFEKPPIRLHDEPNKLYRLWFALTARNTFFQSLFVRICFNSPVHSSGCLAAAQPAKPSAWCLFLYSFYWHLLTSTAWSHLSSDCCGRGIFPIVYCLLSFSLHFNSKTMLLLDKIVQIMLKSVWYHKVLAPLYQAPWLWNRFKFLTHFIVL